MVSHLKKLANSIRRESSPVYKFEISFPIIEQQVFVDNEQLKKDIRESGALGTVTQAKCYRTRWDMHNLYESFYNIGNIAIELAKMNGLAGRTKEDGTPDPIPYGITDSWGLIYKKGNFTSGGIVRGKVDNVVSSDEKDYYVDGISGATVTSKGVENFLRNGWKNYEAFSMRLRQKERVM